MNSYSVKVINSSKQLSKKEELMYTDLSLCQSFDELVSESSRIVIDVAGYVNLAIHNEKSDNVDYNKIVIIDSEGNRYMTGSETFINSFINIYEVMEDSGEGWKLVVMKKPSQNYKGKTFITCSII